MNPAERNSGRIDWLVHERWNVEERLTALRAAARQLLHTRASLDRIRAVAIALRTTLKLKDELERQLMESHCAVQFVYPL